MLHHSCSITLQSVIVFTLTSHIDKMCDREEKFWQLNTAVCRRQSSAMLTVPTMEIIIAGRKGSANDSCYVHSLDSVLCSHCDHGRCHEHRRCVTCCETSTSNDCANPSANDWTHDNVHDYYDSINHFKNTCTAWLNSLLAGWLVTQWSLQRCRVATAGKLFTPTCLSSSSIFGTGRWAVTLFGWEGNHRHGEK